MNNITTLTSKIKKPKFKYVQVGKDRVLIIHLKYPKYIAVFDNGVFNENLSLCMKDYKTDEIPSKLIRKVEALYSSYVS